MEKTEPSTQGKSEDHRANIISITVNGVAVPIHRGRQTVAAIKQAGNVPLADSLTQVIDGVLHALGDGESVTLKGDEVFVSHPKDCGASHAR